MATKSTMRLYFFEDTMRKVNVFACFILYVCTGLIFYSCTSTKTPIKEDTAQVVEPNSSIIVVPDETSILVPEPAFSTTAFAQDLYDALQNGGLDEALLLFNEVPADYKEDFAVNYLHASLLFSSGDYQAAQNLTKQLENKQPDNIDVLLLNTMIAKAQGDTAAKSALLKKIIEKDPSNSDAHVEMAHDQMLRRNYALAKKYYQKGLEGDPANPDALFGLGQSSYYTGDITLSQQAFTKVTQLYPDNSLGWAYLGKLAADDGNYKKATDYIEKAISLEDGYYDFWVDYGNYLRYQGKFSDAEAAWGRAIQINSNHFLAYVYRAALYDEMDEFDKALQDYKKIVQVKPEYPYSYESLGMIYWHKGEWANSRNAFTQAYKINSENISYPLMISATFIKEEKKIENKEFLTLVMRNMDKNSAEYAIVRLYYDGINPSFVEKKILSVTNATLKGKLTFYMGLFYDLNGDDVSAKKQYIQVKSLPSPMFFEYKMNDWALDIEL